VTIRRYITLSAGQIHNCYSITG